jgi:ligand-binding sensor domain-containing protein
MKKPNKLISLIFLMILSLATRGQYIANYSSKDYVYAMNITDDTLWVGTNGGILVADINGNFYTRYQVEAFSTEGLNNNFITSIAVDSAGNKWFGTFDNGIVKYNNFSWENYHPSINAVPVRGINCMEVSQSGVLWVGTSNGVFKFDGTNFQPMPAATISGEILSIQIDGPTIWFGTATNGLYKFDGAVWTNYSDINNLPSKRINDIAVGQDTVYIATDKGLSYFPKSGTTFFNYPGLNQNCLSVEKNPMDEKIWVGTDAGLYYLASNSFFLVDYFNMPQFPLVKFSMNGNLWAGFEYHGEGIGMYDGTSTFFLKYPENAPASNNIAAIATNNYETYFGTKGKGIIKFDGANWQEIPVPYSHIQALALKGDTIFAGTPSGALYLYQGSFFDLNTGGIPVTSIAIDKDQVVWFGTKNGYFDFKNNIQSGIRQTGLSNTDIKKIVVDTLNRVWFLHRDGITVYNRTNFNNYKVDAMGIAGAELTDIAPDTEGGVWITSNLGMIYTRGFSFEKYNIIEPGLAGDKILSVFVDKNNIKYFGLEKNGLILFHASNWKYFGRNAKLSSNKIVAIGGQAPTNTIWLGSEYGGITSFQLPPFSVYTTADQNTVCPGAQVTIDCFPMDGMDSNYRYTWKSENGNIISTDKKITVNPRTTTTYIVSVSDGFLKASDQLTIFVYEISASPIMGPQHPCSNILNHMYSVEHQNNYEYNWSVEGGTFTTSGATPNIINVSWDAAAGNAKIFLSETDYNSGCTVSQEYNIFVEHIPLPEIKRKGENLIICTDSGMVSYIWYFNGTQLSAPKRQFLVVDKTTADFMGVYQVEITSEWGCMAISPGLEFYDQFLKIYPNPGKDYVIISFYQASDESATLLIKDILGNTKESVKLSLPKGEIELKLALDKYQQGIYSFQIIDESSKIKQGKFIVQ